MKIVDDVKLDFSDVLIKPKRSTLFSRKDVKLERSFLFLNSKQEWSGIPIVASNMDTIGTKRMAKVFIENSLMTCLHKFHEEEDYEEIYSYENAENHCILTIGMRDGDFEKGKRVVENNPHLKFICIDVANGYSQQFLRYVERARKEWTNKTLIVGNIVTPEMTEALLLAGADIIKVGIGNGSCCTTRKMAGVGYPQLSAIMECADAAHGLGGHIMGDGGCTCPGDIAKAFGANADFVMLGGMLAGHDECEGELCDYDPMENTQKMMLYGMSSDTAMLKHYGEIATHRASEGKTVYVDYKGPVEKTIQEILGGIRSACTYVGARELKHLSKCTTFIRVNRQLNTIFGD
jgi:GMP reductase